MSKTKGYGTKRKVRKRKEKTLLSSGLGFIFRLLTAAVLIHIAIVLLQGGFHPALDIAKVWITDNIYNGPLAGIVQPACQKLWGWKFTDTLFWLTGYPAAAAAAAALVLKRQIENTSVILGSEDKAGSSWRSGATYRHPSLSLWRKVWYLLSGLYSGDGRNLIHEAKTMAVCRVMCEGREESQDMNVVREWRLDKLIRRTGERMKVEYDKAEHKMALLLPDGSVRILNRGESYVWKFSDSKCMKVMFL